MGNRNWCRRKSSTALGRRRTLIAALQLAADTVATSVVELSGSTIAALMFAWQLVSMQPKPRGTAGPSTGRARRFSLIARQPLGGENAAVALSTH